MNQDFDATWDELAVEVMSGMKAWRLQHPKATFGEIERAQDERLAKMWARMLQDATLASATADLHGPLEAERPMCAECGARLEGRGTAVRRLTTQHNEAEQIVRALPVPPAGPAKQLLRVDGAMVPLVGGSGRKSRRSCLARSSRWSWNKVRRWSTDAAFLFCAPDGSRDVSAAGRASTRRTHATGRGQAANRFRPSASANEPD